MLKSFVVLAIALSGLSASADVLVCSLSTIVDNGDKTTPFKEMVAKATVSIDPVTKKSKILTLDLGVDGVVAVASYDSGLIYIRSLESNHSPARASAYGKEFAAATLFDTASSHDEGGTHPVSMTCSVE